VSTCYEPKLTFILLIYADFFPGLSYSSILSELKENGNLDTAKIIHNDQSYPRFSSLEQLLSHPDDDPIGIRNQFFEMMHLRAMMLYKNSMHW
jgi:hypothetical protein